MKFRGLHMAQIWRETTSKHSFRIQTKDRDLHQKMHSDSRFRLIGTGHNVEVWIYHASFPSMKTAFREIYTLKNKTADTNS
jgi:hypothetical protein